MDFRPYGVTSAQLEQARHYACRGLMCYQPFILADGLRTGAGYEFLKVDEGAGLVYCSEPPAEYDGNAAVQRFLIDPALKDEFVDCNQRLDNLYQNFIDKIAEKVGPIETLTLADVGCCSGYFPISFAKRGARRAVGYDNTDYTPTFELFNQIAGTNAEFVCSAYDPTVGAIPGADTFDVVISIAVLVHLSDPLQHLAFLGSIAKKALLVWTYTSEDQKDELAIHYKSVNRYYETSRFPYCFDVMQISPALLYKSLELMGFTEIHELHNSPGGMHDYWFDRHRGYLALRPDPNEVRPEEPTRVATATIAAASASAPAATTDETTSPPATDNPSAENPPVAAGVVAMTGQTDIDTRLEQIRGQLDDLITAFGWRGRRGLSRKVGAHPNNFLLYAFFGSMKNVGVALRTALLGTTDRVVLIGDAGRIAPVLTALSVGGIAAVIVDWRYGEPIPAVPPHTRPILCEVPETYADYASLIEFRKDYNKISTIWDLTLPLSVVLEAMLLLDYNIGSVDRSNMVPETLERYEEYFEAMCGIYAGRVSLLPCLPRVIELLNLRDRTVIEFGPSDGIHTSFLVNSGARQVTVVEGRPENVVKLLVAQYALSWRNLEIIIDNFQDAGRWADRRYDVAFAHGVFYHCLNPFYFLETLTKITDTIFLGGWVATDTKPLSDWLEVEYGGRTYRVQEYEEVHHFCSGLATKSTFLDAEGVERFFTERGFDVELLEKDPWTEGLTDTFMRWIITRR